MIDLEYEMTFAERIEGPLGPTTGSPARLCWKIAEATLAGPRIAASLAMPGIDWIRVDSNGIRRQDQRTQFLTDDGTLILMRYDAALIRGDGQFSQSLASGRETTFADQYMYMTPQFDVGNDGYSWLTQSLFIGRGRGSLLRMASRRESLPVRYTLRGRVAASARAMVAAATSGEHEDARPQAEYTAPPG